MFHIPRYLSGRTSPRRPGALTLFFFLAAALVAACSSTTPNRDGGSCTAGGTPGPADDHCSAADGGLTNQVVDPAACSEVPPAQPGCKYGRTMYGQEGKDDDCKYRLSWTATPICMGTVTLTLKMASLDSGMPLTKAATNMEVFTTTPGDTDAADYCDSMSSHPTPTNHGGLIAMTEDPPGTYSGSFALDQSGLWTVRFHLFENCSDVPASPHAHAAFHLTVP